jgi:hypothetical protein
MTMRIVLISSSLFKAPPLKNGCDPRGLSRRNRHAQRDRPVPFTPQFTYRASRNAGLTKLAFRRTFAGYYVVVRARWQKMASHRCDEV